jgi:hypothetical protein
MIINFDLQILLNKQHRAVRVMQQQQPKEGCTRQQQQPKKQDMTMAEHGPFIVSASLLIPIAFMRTGATAESNR